MKMKVMPMKNTATPALAAPIVSGYPARAIQVFAPAMSIEKIEKVTLVSIF